MDIHLLTLAELQPYPAADNGLKDALDLLKRGENQETWTDKCEGLTILRRLLAHDANIVVASMHVVILAVVNEVHNLRSIVSRIAIGTVGDMFQTLGRAMEPELDHTVAALLKKAAAEAGSVFIREDLDGALEKMVAAVTPAKAMLALLGSATHKSVLVRCTVAKFLCDLIDQLGSRIFALRESERLLVAESKLVQDAAPEVRYFARKAVYAMMPFEDFDKAVNKHLAGAAQRVVKEACDNLRTKGLGDPPVDTKIRQTAKDTSSFSAAGHVDAGPLSSASASIGRTTLSAGGVAACIGGGGGVVGGGGAGSGSGDAALRPRGKSSVRRDRPMSRTMALEDAEGQDMLVPLLTRLAAPDFRERDQALTMLDDLVATRAGDIASHVVRIFDGFLPRLNDANAKVTLHALDVLCRIIPSLGPACELVVVELTQAVTGCLPSKNGAIHDQAVGALGLMTASLEPHVLLQPYAAAVFYGNVKVKEVMFDEFCALIGPASGRNPKLVLKHGLGVVDQMLSDKRGTMKVECTRLVHELYTFLGDAVYDGPISANNKAVLRAMLKS